MIGVVLYLIARGLLLREYDPDNAVDISRYNRHQHSHTRRQEEQGALLARTGRWVKVRGHVKSDI